MKVLRFVKASAAVSMIAVRSLRPYHILQVVLSTITVVFYSENLFSIMLRAALGSSS
jgi:hypothetical protein